MEKLRRFFKDEEGVTAIEYGLMAALMAAALVVAVGYVTAGLQKGFQTIGTAVGNA